MSPEAQRIAIAEACGWEFVPSHDVRGAAVPEYWLDPEGERHYQDNPLPDYINDLNAIADARKILTDDQKSLFVILLLDGGTKRGETLGCWHCLDAGASRQSEAFLRTIGKWKEAA